MRKRKSNHAFTLAEMLVAVAVLALVVLFVTRLVNSAATITTLGNKRMDTDSQARQLLDRMAVDFDQMLKRNDVSYYLKAGDSVASMSAGGGDVNDRMAFFSAVPGNLASTQSSYQSNVAIVAYRVNAVSGSASSNNRIERLGKGLNLNGGYSGAITPLVFLDNVAAPTTTIASIWPYATDATQPDPKVPTDYELIGPYVLRLEYYCLTSASPPTLVAYPASWTSVNLINIKDVSAIVVAIAAIDTKSRLLLTPTQIATLKGKLVDFTSNWVPGQLLSTWQNALNTDAQIAAMPRPAIQGIRLYERYFYLNQ
jgi:prepilin-type N-terminal cleavage/methylation domain-containing protein